MLAQLDRDYIMARPFKVWARLISYALFEGRPLTTRGQWINLLAFSQLNVWKHLPGIKRVDRPIFILGTGRSGTTILGALLSMHRDVGFLNEPKAMWHVIHPHEDVIGNYDRGAGHYRLTAADATPEMRQTAHRLYGAYLAVTCSDRLVDKYPELIFRIPFVRQLFPDAKFVFLVRNGWDTCSSIGSWSTKHHETCNNEIHDWWGVNRRKWTLMLDELIEPDPVYAGLVGTLRGLQCQTDMAAMEWIVTMREGIRCVHAYENVIHMVKYEDLVQNPGATLEGILNFCELPGDDTFMRYGISRLKLAKPHKPFELHHAIYPLFQKTLHELGYAE